MFDKDEIIRSVNKSWPKDLIIRYLYVKLAPGFQRDLDFFMSPTEIQLAIISGEIPFKKDNIHMFCKTICEYYHELFKEFDIESEVITTNKKIIQHYALIVKGDTCYFCIDPLKDLMRNQTGLRSGYFGFLPKSKTQDNRTLYPHITALNPEYIKEMDQYLGLLSCNMYTEDFLSALHESIFHRPNDRLLNFLSSKNQNIEFAHNIYAKCNTANDYVIEAKIELMNRYIINTGNCPGLMERDQFYDEVVSFLFSRNERRKITIGIQDRELTIVNNSDDGPIAYTESCENGVYKLERKIA